MRLIDHLTSLVFSELPRCIALRFEDFCQGGIFLLQALFRANKAYGGQSGANRQLTSDERCASGSARGLGIVIGEQRAFTGDAINVGVRYPMPPWL